MANTPRMNWPFPNENKDPWYEALENFSNALDASGYAAREDRQLILIGGGTIDWDAVGSILQWSGSFQVVSPISGFLLSVPATSVTIEDGQALYAKLTRAPTRNLNVEVVVENQVPQTDTDYILAIRVGDSIYWRNGLSMDSGDSMPGVTIRNVGAGAKDWQVDFADVYLYTQAVVAVEETVGQAQFDGSRIGASALRFFAMVSPTFAGAGTALVRLYDQGPAVGPPGAAQLVSTLSTIVGGGPQHLDQVLTVAGAVGVNQIMNVPRMYEIRVITSALPGDTIFVGGGGMEVH